MVDGNGRQDLGDARQTAREHDRAGAKLATEMGAARVTVPAPQYARTLIPGDTALLLDGVVTLLSHRPFTLNAPTLGPALPIMEALLERNYVISLEKGKANGEPAFTIFLKDAEEP